MRQSSRSMKFGLLLAILFSCSNDALSCADAAKNPAFQGLAKFGVDRSLVIKVNDYQEIISEISQEVCSRIKAEPRNISIEAAAEKVTMIYFEQVVSYGHATRVSSIAADVLSGTKGLARPDRRASGVVKVICPPEVIDGIVSIDGQNVGGCAKRILLSAGMREVAILSKGKTVCRNKISVAEKQETSCNCAAGTSAALNCN